MWWLDLLRISPIGFKTLLLLQLHLLMTPGERACKDAIFTVLMCLSRRHA
jgi:hypothetical protein